MNRRMMIKEINALKQARNAVILAHYYQYPEVQDIADFVGDSYALSRKAAETEADTIVFCGVHFMAETAKLLSPEKTVLLPEADAGCPMADRITADDLARYKAENPERTVVCYVNSTAGVKALSDVCVTSANAEKILAHYQDHRLLYVPDKNLGNYVKRKFNLDLEAWPGFCCIHNDLTVELVTTMRKRYPDAALIVHPEAPLDVLDEADYVGGTKGLIEYVKTSPHSQYLVGTEEGLLHEMHKTAPEKDVIVLTPDLRCYDMKKTTLESVHRALKTNTHAIEVDPEVAQGARRAIDKMMALSEQ